MREPRCGHCANSPTDRRGPRSGERAKVPHHEEVEVHVAEAGGGVGRCTLCVAGCHKPQCKQQRVGRRGRW